MILNSHTPKQIKNDEKSANYESMQSRFNSDEVDILVKQNSFKRNKYHLLFVAICNNIFCV